MKTKNQPKISITENNDGSACIVLKSNAGIELFGSNQTNQEIRNLNGKKFRTRKLARVAINKAI